MIIWLASYPKSGNTWLRSLLSSYYFSEKGDFNFDLLKKIYGFPEKSFFTEYKNELNNVDDSAQYWISAQNKINSDNKNRLLKTHNALGSINNYDFTNKQNTSGVIYIVRDPRNVITSLKNYYEIEYEEALTFMFNKQKVLYEKTFPLGKYINFNFLGSWSIHYKSWAKNKIFPTLLIKYEDLEKEPFLVIKRVINFIDDVSNSNLKFDENKARKSINSCKFETLQKEEAKNGFFEANLGEKSKKKIKFFNMGKKNNFNKILPPEILKKIITEFSEDLNELKYI